jgi:hypothetical protein
MIYENMEIRSIGYKIELIQRAEHAAGAGLR